MTLIIVLFGLLSGLELILWLPVLWRRPRVPAGVIAVVLPVVSAALVIEFWTAWSVVVAVFSIYRAINLWRLVEWRVQTDYLYYASRQTSHWLIAIQLVFLSLVALNPLTTLSWVYCIAGVQLAAALALFIATTHNLISTRLPRITDAYADRDLPSLTVAIPARNETEDLEACLRSLTASNYPKLEILVLDDCSQNKKTPEIIRNFAHDGVVFVGGNPPPEHWLAKNYAYQQLADEANGNIVLFCGVDARFEADSLRVMVQTLLQTKKSMLSFIPRNQLAGGSGLGMALLQPARYAWELAFPRFSSKRPPVLSTCWLVSAAVLHGAGGFKAISRGSSPESYFARAAMRQGGYSLLQSDTTIGLSSAKTFGEQRDTAIRTRYLQLHRRPEITALLSFVELLVLVAPPVMTVVAGIKHAWILTSLGGLASVLLITVHARFVALAYRRFLWRGLIALPVAALYDIGLLNYSMWQYEFGEVIWKGRNVCVPVMRVISRLPE